MGSEKISNWFINRPRCSGLMVFFILFLGLSLTIYLRYVVVRNNETNEMSNMLNVVHHNIEQSLRNCYATTISLALTIDDNGQVKNFNELGKKLVESNNSIDAVQLVPNGIIKYTYPLHGNEGATNFNILKSPLHRDASLKAIEIQKMYYVGPIELKQGGFGIVGRLPVFKQGKFWGFSAVVIRFNTFLKSSGIANFNNSRYYFQFSKKIIASGKEVFFLKNNSDFRFKTYRSVYIPEGDWTLYIAKKDESRLLLLTLPIYFLAFVFALICGIFVTHLLKKPFELQRQVEQQTQKLINSEMLFKSIFDHAGLGITYTNSATGEFIEVNDKFCELIGYTHDELKKMTISMVTDTGSSNNKNHKNTAKGYASEKKYRHKDGHVIWVNITVTPFESYSNTTNTQMTIVEDISKRKLHEKEIEQSRLSLESLINTIDGIVWEGYPDKPGVTFVSKQTEHILGYTSEEWMSDDYFWQKHIFPEDLDKVLTSTHQWSIEKKPHVHEYRMLHKNGAVIWFQDIVSVFMEKGGSFKFRGILIDISKSKQDEIDLNNSLDLVTEQNKRLLNFSHIVSHNLRSHTSNIQSLVNLIEMCDDKKEQTELLNLLKSVSDALNETMGNLNEVVSIQSDINTIVEEVNLNKFINKTLDILRNQIVSSDAEIINNVSDAVTITFNPAYLESVLLNFISNAIRYKHPDRKPIIELSAYEQDNYKVLEIKDNGIGIDLKKNKEKLFGMYKTFTSNPESRGIGLFITKNQIDAMNGKVEVESEINKGTVFKIYFK